VPIRQDTLRTRWLAQQRYADSTKATYTETLKAFQQRFGVYAEHVSHDMLVDFLTTDPSGEPTRRAPGTLHRQRATLRSFWRWAHRAGYVKHDPSSRLDEAVLGTGQRRPGRWLTRDEARLLLDSTDDGTDQGRRDHLLILLGLLTGLRRAELASLRWRDVDLTSGRLSVRGKGSKFATIGLPEQARQSLDAWRRRTADLDGRARPDGPVLPTGRPTGGLLGSDRSYRFDWRRPLTTWAVRQIVARRAEEAGLGVVATHDLRRSFAGFLDADGAHLQDVQAALRHSSPSVTARCYLDPSPRRAVEAVAHLRI
jgi:integrase/recombinase XerC